MNMHLKLVMCLLAALCGIAFAGPAGPSRKVPLPPAVSDSISWFAVREMGGSNMPFTRNHLQKLASTGERAALVYFATWCVPCRAGMKKLVASKAELEKNGVKVVLVNAGEREEAKIKQMVESLGANVFPVVLDPYKRLSEGIGLIKEGENIALPMTLVVDKAGKPLFMVGEEGNDWPSILWTGTR